MKAEEWAGWDRLISDLALPDGIREHIEEMAERNDLSPRNYVMTVLWRDIEASRELVL